MKKFTYNILLLLPIIVFSQLNPNSLLPEVMPSNPQAFQFMKYGEIPVGKYTGVPDISVPIYTINAKGLNIPILMSYHSNGFKVNEEAGWTGLGWTLQAGGSINQIVSGTDDFGYFKRRQLQDLTTDPLFNLPQSAIGACSSFVVEGSVNVNTFSGSSLCNVGSLAESANQVAGYGDSQPDIFKFSMLGYSGSFILDWKNETFVCLSDKNIKIEAPNYINSNNTPFEFFIIVPDGHRFRFNLKEEGEYLLNLSTGSNGAGNPQADLRNPGERAFRTYQLTEIITNKGDVITFNYSQTNNIVGYPSISKQYFFIEPNFLDSGLFSSPTEPLGYKQSDLTTSLILTKQKQFYLSSIVFKNGSIVFTTSDRLDILGAKKLDKIEIKNTTGTIKTFNFSFNYFIGHANGTNMDNDINNIPANLNASKTNTELTHRLKLLSITELGQKPYSFEYYETFALPKKTSLAMDYWGYYNGYLTNTSIFPNFYRLNLYRDKTYLMQFKDNNKSPSLEHSKSAVLKKISYPAGGNTQFVYELNSFNNFNVPEMSQGTLSTVNISTVPFNISGLKTSKAVLIEGGNTIFTGSAQLNIEGCYPQYPNAYANCYVNITHYKKEIIPLVKAVPNYQTYGIEYALTQINNVSQYIDSNNNAVFKAYNSPLNENFSNLLYSLTEGIVVFKVSGGCGVYGSGASSSSSGNVSRATLSLTYRDYKPLLINNSYGAGLRIKSILSFLDSNNSNLIFSKNFEYEGGKIMSPLVYTKKTLYRNSDFKTGGDTGCQARVTNGIKYDFDSSTIQPISTSASGNYVGYNKVTEIYNSNNYTSGSIVPTNGKTVSFYTNEPDITGIGNGLNISNHVLLPSEKYYLDNGLLIKEQVIKDNGALLNEVNNSYQTIASDKCFYGYRFAHSRTELGDIVCIQKCQINQVGGYTIKRRQKPLLVNSLQTSYYGQYNLGNPVTNNKVYSYDSYNQVSNVTETKSNGETILTKFKYPYDFLTQSPFMAMVSSNFLTPIVEKEILVNNVRVQLERFDYYQSQGNIIYTYPILKYSQSKDVNGGLNEYIQYHKYGNLGNIEEVSKKDGMRIVYIWGYNKVFPIAKIENATYSQVQNYEANLQTLSNGTNEDNLITALNNLRTALPNAMVTTFTYKPLIGISTITDTKGDKMTYHYDSFNRLQFVKDQNGNILSENDYHYKN